MYCLTDFCCICFCKKQPFKHLSDTDNDNITYYVKLTSCVPEMCFKEINNQRFICKKCCETMNTVYKFRQTCLRSKSKLIDYISQLCIVNGGANTHLIHTQQEYQNENNIETEIEQIYLLTDIKKHDNVIENIDIKSEHNPATYDLTDNTPSDIRMKIIKTEHKDQNSERYTEARFAGFLESQNQVNVNIIENKVKLTPSEIKKESENEDIEDCLSKKFDNILPSCDNENANIEIKLEDRGYCVYLKEHLEDPLMNRDEIKIDIVNHDVKLLDHDMNNQINMDRKMESFGKLANENHINATALDSFSCYATKEDIPASSLSKGSSICNKEDKKIEHLRIDADEKSHECNTCKKKFSRAQNLRTHMRIHTGEKPYECTVCKQRFNQPQNLNCHMKLHTGQKTYECNVCQKKFNWSQNLRHHMKLHTAEKPYDCGVCQMKFSRSSELKIHMKIHRGATPYECDVCRKKFILLYHLNRHMIIHTGEKPYECSLCKKKFNQSEHLKQHMRIHTDKKP